MSSSSETIFVFLGQGNGRNTPTNMGTGMGPRRNSTMELFQEGQEADIEYFFASDASAIIEHTNRVIYLEVRIKGSLSKLYQRALLLLF